MTKQKLGTLKLTSFLISNMVGSGIFITPIIILKITQSIIPSLICWLTASLFTILLGISYSKLGCRYPKGNGDPYYLTNLYYPWVASFYTFISVFIVLPGGCSIMLDIISRQLKTLDLKNDLKNDFKNDLNSDFKNDFRKNDFKNDLTNNSNNDFKENNSQKLTFGTIDYFKSLASLIIISSFCLLNFNQHLSVNLQNILTILKTILIFLFIPLMIRRGKFKIPLFRKVSIYQLLLGAGSCTWCFDGWNSANFICSEIRNVKKSLRVAIVGSVVFVSILYFFINLSFYCVISDEHIQEFNDLKGGNTNLNPNLNPNTNLNNSNNNSNNSNDLNNSNNDIKGDNPNLNNSNNNSNNSNDLNNSNNNSNTNANNSNDLNKKNIKIDNNLVNYFFDKYCKNHKIESILSLNFIFYKLFPSLIVIIPSISAFNGSLIVSRSIINHYFESEWNRKTIFAIFCLWIFLLTFVNNVFELIKIVGLFVVLFYGLVVRKVGFLGKVGFFCCVVVFCVLVYDRFFG
ncbi:hypothetical protein DMUE_2448 [Dictyocoela muelleri]|nr:hypothetical protein DMUE_2448 [Dictyocoela muelleri]